jgi:alpha-galactosidase
MRPTTVIFLATLSLSAQPIQYNESRKTFLLTTAHNSYTLGIAADGALRHLYWGSPLWRPDDLAAPPVRRDLSSFDPRQMLEAEEYPGWGGPRFYEPALKITREDGVRDLVLRYVSHKISGADLDILLKDINDPIEVSLHYHVYSEYGIVRRSSTIRNATARTCTVESAQSAVWNLPPGEGYSLTYVSGRWAAESQIHREPIHEGQKVIESRKGHTSHTFNPWFAIDAGDATEEYGRVWFGALAWSGNWRISVEQTPYRQVRVAGGFNSFDFSYPLRPGESLDTPAFYAGYSDSGFGDASRLLHRFTREKIIPGGATSRLRPVLYNSWEATTFAVNETGQRDLAAKAAKLGVELFVMDDGWFGARNNDRGGLGDWVVNPQKFRKASSRSSITSTRLGWTSASGSSQKWSTPTAISTALTLTGSSTFPAARAANCATRWSSISRAPTSRSTSSPCSTNSPLTTTSATSSGT